MTKDKIIFIALSLAVWFYIWLRAIFVPFQIDEIGTFLLYIQPGRFIPPDIAWDANNHLLNSLISWIVYQVSGPTEWALRLPNILSAPLYFYFIYRISRLLQNRYLRWIFILASIGTHFIIEFFSYCRGYGLSMALFSGALYYLLRALADHNKFDQIKAVLFMILSVSANLTILPVSIIVYSLVMIDEFNRWKHSSLKKSILVAGFSLIACGTATLLFTMYSLKLANHGAFYYGDPENNFLNGTVKTLAGMVAGKGKIVAVFYFAAGFLYIIALSIKSLAGRKMFSNLTSPHLVFPLLLAGSITGIILMHYLLKINYPEDRAALYLLPLFYGSVCFIVDQCVRKGFNLQHLAATPLLLIPLLSLTDISLEKTLYGPGQHVPEQFFRRIAAGSQPGQYPPTIAGYQVRRHAWAWRNYKNGGNLNPLFVSDFPNNAADYLIGTDVDIDILNRKSEAGRMVKRTADTTRTLEVNAYKKIDEDIRSGIDLYQRINPRQKKQIIEKSSILTDGKISDRYYLLLQTVADSLAGKDLYISLDFIVESKAVPFEGVFVVEIFDSLRRALRNEGLDLDQLRPSWNRDPNRIKHIMLVHQVPDNASEMIIYFWNKREVKYSLSNGVISLFSN